MADLPVRIPLHTEPMGIVQSARAAQRNILEVIPEIATRAPILSGRTGLRWHMVMDPESLRHILRDRVDDYPKSDTTRLVLGPAIGNSLFVAEGEHWHWQRRATAPVFTHRNVSALAPVMTAAAERSAERIAASVGRAADLYAEMVTATYEVISDVTFSGDDGFDRAAVHRAIETYIAQTARVSLFDVIGLPAWVPRPGRLGAGRELRAMKAVADAAIDRRRAAGPHPVPDLLDLLLRASDPGSGRRMTTAEMRDNLLTFIVAGHETTALTLAWALYLCAHDPAVQAAARAEAQAVLAGGRAARAEDLPALPLSRRIIDESLRLYPPAALLARTARAPDSLCGREVRPGDTVILPIYALHRHHALWQNPDAFDPARFASPPPRFSYLPFGDGPRICIGASFALQEAVIILATLLARFRFSAVPGKVPRPVMILTLRPEGGVWLMVEPA